jgi:glycyl-tRNA synthetase
VDDLRVVEMDGGEYVVIEQKIEGQSASKILDEALVNWIVDLHVPRSMRWNDTQVAFSRPIRWLVCLLDERVVPMEYAGVRSGRVTRGPRPVGSPEIALASAMDYTSTLASYGVIVDPQARRDEIVRQAQAVAAEVEGELPDDDALLIEVANLVEVPTAIRGSFEKRYLTLPQDVLIAVMKKHQRYFPVLDRRGRIMSYFVTIRNGGREYIEIVREGNEDVIRARYADAEYFYNQDCRQHLESFREDLEKLTFQADLGSMLDKTKRLEALTPWIGRRLGLDTPELDALERAAYLAKADLATKMVVEMTSLQGVMGREYARRSGESAAVADAIYEHYLPRSAADALPQSGPGMALALADRADSLVGLFAVGMAPSGSADPYGLRRAASGIVQILLERQLSLSLSELFDQASATLDLDVGDETLGAVLEFTIGRLRGALRDEGLAYDVVEAALASHGDNPLRAQQAAKQLSAWVDRENWTGLLDNYARCVRITREQPAYELDASILEEEASIHLYQALQDAESQLDQDSEVDEFLVTFQSLIDPIQVFFDEVLVMAEDPEVRRARLALLQRVSGLACGIADLSHLEGF